MNGPVHCLFWLGMSVVLLGLPPDTTRASAAEPAPVAVELVPPTGPLSIGRTSYHWIEPERAQGGAAGDTKREILVHLWYPAQADKAAETAPYIPGFATLQTAIGENTLREAAGSAYAALSSARTHAIADAAMSPAADKYSAVLLTHGLRFHSLGYSMLAEDLASHGYVVVGIDHPSTAFSVLFPDGRVTLFDEPLWSKRRTAAEKSAFECTYVERCAEDLVFALDQLQRLESGALPNRFAGRLDLARVGVFGHSFGGRTAAKACQLDKRLKAGVISDALGRQMTVDKRPDGSTLDQPVMIQYARRVPTPGLPRFLALLQTPGEDLEQTLRLVRQEFCESVKGVSYELTLSMPGIVHESFSDIPFLASGQDDAAKKGCRSAIDITRTYTRAFFDRHLRSSRAPLDNPPQNASEVELTHHTFRGQ